MKCLAVCLVFLTGIGGVVEAQTSDRKCSVTAVDTLHYGSAQVYRDCDVDQPATKKRGLSPSYMFSGDSSCVTADVEFLVDESGQPVIETARVIAASSARFGEASIRGLKNWRYDPARKDGVPVRQVVRERVAKQNDRLEMKRLEPGERMPVARNPAACK
jgi:hypothetical protein